MSSRTIAKYLARHAEPEARLADRISGQFGHALVVPSYAERESLFRLLGSVPAGPAGPVLIVVVLNARADSPKHIHEGNAADRLRLQELELTAQVSSDPPISAYATSDGTLLLIDRADSGHFLPEGQGVGLARKIGNDLVLALSAAGRVAAPWIHNTDADVILTPDYFERTPAPSDATACACAIYPFDHRFEDDPDRAQAARLYEISLRYYVLGLAWAGSPYAYQSMGSCLAIAAEAYAAVRGFPKKNAAEDFYVLNKLAKVGSIVRLSGAPLQLEGRVSDRVPFGTGRAIGDLLTHPRSLPSFRLYHPLVFAHLAGWLDVLAAIARSNGDLQMPLDVLPRGNPFFRADLLEQALAKLGAFEAVREAAAKSSDEATLSRHLHTWFDAFKTRKLLHALRDAGFPSLPWREALSEAPFTQLAATTEDDPEVLRRLLSQEELRLTARTAGISAAANRLDPLEEETSQGEDDSPLEN